MKRLGILLFWALAVFLAVFAVLGIFVACKGKPILEARLTSAVGQPVSVDKLGLRLPLAIEVSGLTIGDMAKVKRVRLSPGRLEISEPVINLVKAADGSLNIPAFAQAGKSPPFYVTSLMVTNGRLIFTDNHITPQGTTIIADRINVDVAKVSFPPASLRTNYRLSAVFTDNAARELGTASGAGWIDFGPKDMDGSLSIENFEATTAAPYYSDYISTKKLTSAKLTMTCKLFATHNDLTIKTNLKLFDLVYAKTDQEATGLDFFSDKTGAIQYAFTYYTKLDNPTFAPESVRRALQEAIIGNLVSQDPQDIVQKFKAIGKEFKAKWKENKEQ